MKYIVTYSAPRKNAVRHVETSFGWRCFYDSVEEAKYKSRMWSNPHYDAQITTANFKDVIEEITSQEKRERA